MATPAAVPADPLGFRIANLLALHPTLAAKHVGLDVTLLDAPSKAALFADLNADLGIRPIKTRILGYVPD